MTNTMLLTILLSVVVSTPRDEPTPVEADVRARAQSYLDALLHGYVNCVIGQPSGERTIYTRVPFTMLFERSRTIGSFLMQEFIDPATVEREGEAQRSETANSSKRRLDVTPPVVQAQMLIRKPVAEVFEAFVDPAITTKFWFTKSSGRLETGKKLLWEWEMYGASGEVHVKEVVANERILIEWGDPPTAVEWRFTSRQDGTLVVITNSGFTGSDDEVVAKAIDSMGGFTSLLAGSKAYLEHGVELNLVGDHHPDAHVK